MASLVDKTAIAGAPGLRGLPFILALIAVGAVIFAIGRWYNNSYAFFMAYVVAQYIVLGTAWNILGGYTGYVNFGVTAFFAIGAYSTVVWHKLTPAMPFIVLFAVLVFVPSIRRTKESSDPLAGVDPPQASVGTVVRDEVHPDGARATREVTRPAPRGSRARRGGRAAE